MEEAYDHALATLIDYYHLPYGVTKQVALSLPIYAFGYPLISTLEEFLPHDAVFPLLVVYIFYVFIFPFWLIKRCRNRAKDNVETEEFLCELDRQAVIDACDDLENGNRTAGGELCVGRRFLLSKRLQLMIELSKIADYRFSVVDIPFRGRYCKIIAVMHNKERMVIYVEHPGAITGEAVEIIRGATLRAYLERRTSELIGPPQSSDISSGIGAAFGGLPDTSHDSDYDSDSSINSDTGFDSDFEMPSFS